MRFTGRLSSIEALRPMSHGDRRVLYELVRDALLESRLTEPALAKRLAVISVHHLAGEGGRVLLRCANDGCDIGLVRGWTDLLDLPLLEINAGLLAEMNWSGADLGFFLDRLYGDLSLRYPATAVPVIAEHACVFIHSLDTVRIAGRYTSVEATQSHREGQQQSLAAVCSGEGIPVAGGPGQGYIWRSGSALVIAAAHFDGLPAGPPDPDDMVGWGLIPALARALAGFSVIELPASSAARIEGAVRKGVNALRQTFHEFGFHLDVTEQAIRYVTEAISSGRHSGGPDAAGRWIADAAGAALIRLLEERAPVGTRYTLALDDLTLPKPGRGWWRE
jgi:hypothetical protein